MGLITFDSTNSNYTYLSGIKSPEFTFNNNTILKEAIFKALEKIDAIPRLKYVDNKLVLDLDFVNKLNDLIESENDFTNKYSKQDVSEYATVMVSEL